MIAHKFCSDCKYFEPIGVSSGWCNKYTYPTWIDHPACDRLEEKPKEDA